MALTQLQRTVCQLLAEHRIASGESYVAGGVALNEAIAAARISRDIDLFHDTDEALEASWQADRALLRANGFSVLVVRERPTFVEAEVGRDGEHVRLEWARDSAFRFFPLQRHEEFGLTLHPFDLATNKVLALVGRLEVRDWIDVIATDQRLQPLGYLAWAACGKDPGYGPASILEGAARSGRYSREEVQSLLFEGDPPDAAELCGTWHGMLNAANQVIAALPLEEVGTCVLNAAGGLSRASPEELPELLYQGGVLFHHGAIRGAVPRLKG
ncbi:MAG: nucleotidyl transferase AbiEii/AbiGii toxin family protein [Chloroflexi bacterium]|nr:nucleotidyl transferase AbiEii/AbiGii toxin family protein [Chloroflexota bacterium]